MSARVEATQRPGETRLTISARSCYPVRGMVGALTFGRWLAIALAILAALVPVWASAAPGAHWPSVAGEPGCHSSAAADLASADEDDPAPAHDADEPCLTCHAVMLPPAIAGAGCRGHAVRSIAAWRADSRPDVVPDAPQEPPRRFV